MSTKELFAEKELAALAKKFRVAAGKNRSEAAREMGVARPSLIHAEDHPEKTLVKLRRRIIESYSDHEVVGPLYLLQHKRKSR